MLQDPLFLALKNSLRIIRPYHWLSFFNHPAPTEIYTLSLHDALPIFSRSTRSTSLLGPSGRRPKSANSFARDRKSTRLNSSHTVNSYAVFCLKKKKSPTIH